MPQGFGHRQSVQSLKAVLPQDLQFVVEDGSNPRGGREGRFQ